MFDYHKRTFRAVSNAPTGEVSAQTIFRYRQRGAVVWATYAGGTIVRGHLLGLCDAAGGLEFSYHHLNRAGQLMTGRCRSVPERLPDGRLRLHEKWRWTCGDFSEGESVIEEIPGGGRD